MAKRQLEIRRMDQKDKNMLEHLAHVAVATPEQIQRMFTVNPQRMAQSEYTGYIKLEDKLVLGQERSIASLTDRGKEYCKAEGIVAPDYQFPIWNTNALPHDLLMGELKGILPSIENWRTENMVKNDMRAERNLEFDTKIRSLDATFEISREDYLKMEEEYGDRVTFINFKTDLPDTLICGCEAIGDSYSPETCQMKIDAGQSHCDVMILAERG